MGCDIHTYLETAYVDDEREAWFQFCELHIPRNYLLFALMAGVRRYTMLPDPKLLGDALESRGVKKLDDPFLSETDVENILTEASDSGITRGQPSFPAKGAPKNMNWRTANKYTYHVSDDPVEDGERTCTKERAVGWLKSGASCVWKELDGEVTQVTSPDVHTSSWLDTQEMETLAARMKLTLEATIPNARATQEQSIQWARKALERAQASHDTEGIVFAKRELERESDWSRHDPLRDESLVKVEAITAMMRRLEKDGRVRARLVFWFDN